MVDKTCTEWENARILNPLKTNNMYKPIGCYDCKGVDEKMTAKCEHYLPLYQKEKELADRQIVLQNAENHPALWRLV